MFWHILRDHDGAAGAGDLQKRKVCGTRTPHSAFPGLRLIPVGALGTLPGSVAGLSRGERPEGTEGPGIRGRSGTFCGVWGRWGAREPRGETSGRTDWNPGEVSWRRRARRDPRQEPRARRDRDPVPAVAAAIALRVPALSRGVGGVTMSWSRLSQCDGTDCDSVPEATVAMCVDRLLPWQPHQQLRTLAGQGMRGWCRSSQSWEGEIQGMAEMELRQRRAARGCDRHSPAGSECREEGGVRGAPEIPRQPLGVPGEQRPPCSPGGVPGRADDA